MKKLAQTLIAISALFCFLPLGFGQNPQTPDVSNIPTLFAGNAKWTNGISPGYWPTVGSGLTLELSSGTSFCGGSIVTYAGGTLSLAASSTNYVYLDTSSSCAPAYNTTGFSASIIPIATVDTNASAITSITDDRTYFVTPGSGGGSGITSLNGLTAGVQTFATGTSGTDFNIASSGSIHTFNFPDASASARGLLTSAEWTTFNSKVGIYGTPTAGDCVSWYSATEVQDAGGSCSGGAGSSLFTSFQVGSATPITGTDKYFQLAGGPGVTLSLAGSGTSSSPYVATVDMSAGSNASQIQSIPVSSTAPTDGQMLAYNATAGDYEPTTPSSGSGSISVNGSAVSSPNLNDTTPAVANGGTNVKFQTSGSNVSAYVPEPSLFSPDKPSGTLANAEQKGQTVAAGATDTIMSISGSSGYVTSLMVASQGQSANWTVYLIVTVDGEATPSINMPISDACGDHYLESQPSFFGQWMDGTNGPSSLGVGCTIKLPVPFSTSIEVQLKNTSTSTATIWSDITYRTGVSDSWLLMQHLYATTMSASGVAANTETNLINVTTSHPGRLAAIGWIYDAYPGSVSPATGPLEGAFKIYLNGSATASYSGSGSEDFFFENWYFRAASAFGTGASKTMTPPSTDIVNTVMTSVTWGAERFFVNDPITFTNGLRVSWTCGNTAAVSFTGTCTVFGTVWYYTEN